MDHVTGIGWPGSGQRLLLGMMQTYFGGGLRHFTTPSGTGTGEGAALLPGAASSASGATFVLERDEALTLPQTAGRKYLIQHRGFTSWVMSAYDHAVRQDPGCADSAAGFASFASRQFTAYRGFMDRWVRSEFATTQFLLSYEQLIVYPLDSLRLAVWWLDPDSQIDETRLSAALAQAGLREDRDPAAFRHHEATLFNQFDKLCLTREEVHKCCLDLLGREPAEKSYLPFQCCASIGAMEEALRASAEYRIRQEKLASERGSVT